MGRMVIGKEETTIVTDGKQAEAMEKRIQQIRTEAENTDSQFDKEKAEERVAALGGGIARIKVGAATETELKDKKLRYEDAINSTKAAIEMGITPGGGATLLNLTRLISKIQDSFEDEEEKLGAAIIGRACEAPILQIAKNCGKEGEVVLDRCKNMEFGMGYNAATDSYENLFESGVVDPVKVTCWALENSCSIAAMVLTTEALIVEIPEKIKENSRDKLGDLPGEEYY